MATFGSFFHQGPICLNTRRVIVQRKTANEFLGKFSARTKTLPSGDPLDPKRVLRASPTCQTSSGSTRVVENASFRSNEAPKDE